MGSGGAEAGSGGSAGASAGAGGSAGATAGSGGNVGGIGAAAGAGGGAGAPETAGAAGSGTAGASAGSAGAAGIAGQGGGAGTETCSDDTRNGDETDVDCGGPDCDPCPNGGGCISDGDCLGFCEAGICYPMAMQSCFDELQNGDDLQQAPENTASVWAEYYAPVADGWDLQVFGAVNYRDEASTSLENYLWSDDITLLNGRIALYDNRNHWSVALYGNNLLDDDGLVSRSDNSGGAVKGMLTTPRTYGLQVVKDF